MHANLTKTANKLPYIISTLSGLQSGDIYVFMYTETLNMYKFQHWEST